MFRIDSSGATVDNRFTEGDPALSIPSTVVSAEWLNNVQEELVKTIEEMGIGLDKLQENQHWEALLEFAKRGGRKLPYLASVANNTGPADLQDTNNANAVLSFDKTSVKAVIAKIDIERRTDTQNVQETGHVIMTYDTNDDEWKIRLSTVLDDAGVVLTTTAVDANVEKVQYTTNNLTGTTYVGELRLTDIVEIRQ